MTLEQNKKYLFEIFLCIYCLFNNAISSSEDATLNDGIIKE
jgi:hypothetical protein